MQKTVFSIVRWSFYGVLGWLCFTCVWAALYGFVRVPLTPLMIIRSLESKGDSAKKKPRVSAPDGWKQQWVRLEQISPYLIRAIIMAEDQKFYQHYGFDFEAIEKAIEHNQKAPTRKKGASTISQQTAKNVFLWPGRNWLRKGLETYFTGVIELMWSKDRILEIYLNVIEFGPGIYGAESAAQYFFHKSAQRLSVSEAALMAASLPNPLKLKINAPGPYMSQRQEQIVALIEGRRKEKPEEPNAGLLPGADSTNTLPADSPGGEAGNDEFSESDVDGQE